MFFFIFVLNKPVFENKIGKLMVTVKMKFIVPVMVTELKNHELMVVSAAMVITGNKPWL